MNDRTPKLDALEMTASIGVLTERLSQPEYQLLEQLLRYPEQLLRRESLTTTVMADEPWVPDRILDRQMSVLIAKLNVLHPQFPLIVRVTRDTWIYSEVAPKRKPGRA